MQEGTLKELEDEIKEVVRGGNENRRFGGYTGEEDRTGRLGKAEFCMEEEGSQ